jgi:predicted RNA polymerase sigma factor
LQNRLIQTSQTGGQRYSDTSPFSIPWFNFLPNVAAGPKKIVFNDGYNGDNGHNGHNGNTCDETINIAKNFLTIS